MSYDLEPTYAYSTRPWRGSHAVQYEDTWPNLVAHLFSPSENTPEILADKKAGTLFLPVMWIGTGIKKVDVSYVSCLVLDFDKGLDAHAFAALKEYLSQWQHVWHMTFNCYNDFQEKGLYRARAIIPLSAPVDARKWPEFWAKATGIFGEWPMDVSCKDCSRGYGVPAAPAGPEGSTSEAWEWYCSLPLDTLSSEASGVGWMGCNLDAAAPTLDASWIMSLTGHGESTGPGAGAGHRPTHLKVVGAKTADFEAVRQRVAKEAKKLEGKPKTAHLGAALHMVLLGRSYAEDGERNSVLFQLTAVIARLFPAHEASFLAELFTTSQEQLAIDNARARGLADGMGESDSLEVVAATIQRHQDRLTQERQDFEVKKSTTTSRFMMRAVGVGEPDYRYTPADREQIAASLGVPVDALDQYWIIHEAGGGKMLFIVTKTGLHLVSDKKFRTELLLLQPTGLDLYKVVNRDFVPKASLDFAPEVGVELTGLRYDYNSSTTKLNPNTRVLTIGVPRSKLAPKAHEHVQEWLELLFAEDLTQAMNWLAMFPDTTRLLPIMSLTGAADVGKSLFVAGLAGIWEHNYPIPFTEVVAAGGFNGRCRNTPLIHTEENFPYVKGLEDILRQLTTSYSFQAMEKFRMPFEVLGARRLVVTANSLKLKFVSKDMDNNDARALHQRIWTCRVSDHNAQKITQMLMDMGHERRVRMAGHEIAEHVLYLQQAWRVEDTGKRFLVSSDKKTVDYTLKLADRGVTLILELIKTLMDKSMDPKTGLRRDHLKGLRWGGGEILMNAEGVVSNWEVITRNHPRDELPTSPAVQIRKCALHDNAGNLRRGKITEGSKRHNAHKIDVDLFLAYLVDHFGLEAEDVARYKNAIVEEYVNAGADHRSN